MQICIHKAKNRYTIKITGQFIYIHIIFYFFPLFLTNVFFFTVDLLAGQPADWTTIEIIALLIIYLPGTRALLRQLIKPVKDL